MESRISAIHADSFILCRSLEFAFKKWTSTCVHAHVCSLSRVSKYAGHWMFWMGCLVTNSNVLQRIFALVHWPSYKVSPRNPHLCIVFVVMNSSQALYQWFSRILKSKGVTRFSPFYLNQKFEINSFSFSFNDLGWWHEGGRWQQFSGRALRDIGRERQRKSTLRHFHGRQSTFRYS